MESSQVGKTINPTVAESPPVDIAPDGDVIFVVGDEQRRLRVHSVILRTASSVFKAMLGPHFREGANLSSEHPTAIPLPDDDPETMEILFNIIHFRLNAVKERYEPEEILYLAIATDKYNLVEALQLSTHGWLECGNIRDPDGLWHLAKASYLLRNDQAFRASTLWLVFYHGGSFYQLNDAADMSFNFEDRLGAMLEERRCRIRMDLVCRFARSNSSQVFRARVNSAHICTISLERTIRTLDADDIGGSMANGIVQGKIEQFATAGLGGLCLTCVRTGKDHQSHNK